jgi:hypothetical protein
LTLGELLLLIFDIKNYNSWGWGCGFVVLSRVLV